jgi:hypothetical protein
VNRGRTPSPAMGGFASPSSPLDAEPGSTGCS